LNKFKKCSKCKEEKSLDCFGLNKNGRYGVGNRCKDCNLIYFKEYYLKNKEYFNKRSREYYLKNKENLRKKSREYNSKNKEKINKYFKEYRSKNKENCKKIVKKYKKKQREQLEDGYIVQLITQNTGLTTADIPSELIEAKRLEIKIKRIIKEE